MFCNCEAQTSFHNKENLKTHKEFYICELHILLFNCRYELYTNVCKLLNGSIHRMFNTVVLVFTSFMVD